VAIWRIFNPRPVHIIVGYAPGGTNDISARLMGQWLSERLGRQFVIENRPGAGSNLATETVVHAPPDGYTLLLVNTSNVINPALYDKLNFNFVGDITPVAGIIRAPQVMARSLFDPRLRHRGGIFAGSHQSFEEPYSVLAIHVDTNSAAR
jgi:tripartite-type tricarboxylate transporter receptor subunit TctC